MVSVAEASDIVFSNLLATGDTSIALTDAVGSVLREPVYADRDLPPFNRVTMDGLAIRFESWKQGQREFTIEGIQAAGHPVTTLSNPANAIEVMTGSMLPVGTDTVIRYEDLVITEAKAVIAVAEIEKGQSIHLKGSDAQRKEILLEPGIVLLAAEISLLASVGKNEVRVASMPKAAIISSGDELVAVTATPEEHQVRRSNTYSLEAAMKQQGWQGIQYHLEDNKVAMIQSLVEILSISDVLIISGGVSKGKFDFMPEALEAAGVKKLFHQVSQRPGKPFWFGKSADGKIVFALPGNPVSTFMCYYRYILPWLWKSLGVATEVRHAVLAEDYSFKPALTYFLQVSIRHENGTAKAYPDSGGGSGDFANLKNVDGFLELPKDRDTFRAGEVFPYFSFR